MSEVSQLNHTALPNCLICMGGEETTEISSVAQTLPYALECNIDYFAEMMRHLQQQLPRFEDYTFVFTRSVDELPAKFDITPNLVVFVMGDEWARVPVYAPQAHAIFKAPGQHIKLAPHQGYLGYNLRFNVMATAQYLRLHLKRFKGYRQKVDNIFAIPYGYYRLPRRENVTPINERRLDVSFTGSIDHKKVLGGLIKTSKVLSRERMVAIVNQWQKDQPFAIDVKLSTFFPKANDKPQHEDYPSILMDSKIILAPRGTHLETYRVCEGMYYGCVIIAEEQPNHWFAENSPAIIVNDWKKLPAILEELLNNPERLEKVQQQSLAYWDETLSAQAVANYICKSLASRPALTAANDGYLDQSDSAAG